ncbi:Polyketide cyclase / dehydrase and lipid transport [Pseudonocardia oroxyli]|uniref:Polyketide cyclase / dehydrase and lipid transport n=1 Tax=Pseudonocardia oroxyli TaxID=366584 RepID=A0A1G7QJ78_PSEOR|nr:Polyketide cyclase / dehydrase and lipid transport [Pseudonocardia oroxyli]
MRAVRELVVAEDVAAPASAVWDLVTDWERQGEWILFTRVRVVAGDGRSAGSVVVAVTGIGDLGVVDTFTVTGYDEAARRVDVRHTGLVVTGDSSFVVTETGPASCRFTWTEGLELPFGRLGALGWPVLRPVMAAGFGASVRRLGRLAEAEYAGSR